LRIHFEKVSFPSESSLRVSKGTGFDAPYSYHPEYEIVYIISGSGTRLIGQKTEYFEGGEVVLLGPNLYHWWKPADNPRHREQEKAIVIQWPEKLFEKMHKLPEMKQLKKLEMKSLEGIFFDRVTCKTLIPLIEKLYSAKENFRIPYLIEILLTMSEVKTTRGLSGKINKTCDNNPPLIEQAVVYILKNLNENIKMENVAGKFHLSEAHFSRLFKKSTGMSFPKFINKNRIFSICQAMDNEELNIAQLAFSFGYENLSTFNKAFKEIMGITPLKYRKINYN
jgi:AraC-like DNA-binding protein